MVVCPSWKSVAAGTFALVLALLPMQTTFADEVATPPVSEITTTTKGAASETRFPPSAEQLLTVDGMASGWTPVSIRYFDGEDALSVFVELRNDTGADQLTPRLYAHLSLEGVSYGQDAVPAMNAWTPAGESAYFQTPSFYSGSLALGDWDAASWYIENETYNDPATQDTSRVSVKDGRITNETDSVVGEILFATMVHDEEGVFVGGCTGPLTGANIPPGKSIRVRDLHEDGDSLPICLTLNDGMASSKELGIDGDFSTTTLIAYISEP